MSEPARVQSATPTPAMPESESVPSLAPQRHVQPWPPVVQPWVGPRLGWWLGILVGVVLLLVVLGWLLTRVQEPVSTATDTDLPLTVAAIESAGAGGGAASNIAARSFDAADRPPSEHTTKPYELDTYRELLEEGEVVDINTEDRLEWLEARMALLDPTTAFAAQEDCYDRYGDFGPEERCAYRLAVVFEREQERSKVVYARAIVDESGDFAECSDFANCMAATRLGRHAPTPARAGERFAVSLGNLSVAGNQDRVQDVERVREIIAQMETMLEQAREADLADEDPGVAFRLAMQERLIEFWKLRLARLEGAS